ncbi:MAG: DUF1194 domain-containing protein [Rhodobacteraceae bacterium]|nr:DUF1194 domain-containing protein [Paracoccaceae bacterium]
MVKCLALLWSLLAAAQAGASCRQALALGLDVSGSVDSFEYRLQIDGLANALGHPDVTSALLAMPSAPVSIAIFEWSGPDDQRLLHDWIAVTDEQVLDQIITALRRTRRGPGDPSTALGAAMQFGLALLDQKDRCWKRTLDISGDGKNNTGRHPREITSRAEQTAITINGLVIGAETMNSADQRQLEIADLWAFYKLYVISGPDAFIETAIGFRDFENAMVRKLKRELQGQLFSRASQ